MATERQSPDAIITQINLSGSLSAIQDDPDSPDGNWWTALDNNSDTIVQVSFPAPTGNPTVGPDLQEFKIWVRKMGGTGTPKVRIELYENPFFLATLLADTNVTSTSGVLLSGTWNANLLGTANGSLVECRVYGTKSGGGPSVRATVEVGAVEWNVTYGAGVTHLGVATLVGVGTLVGIGALTLTGLASLVGSGALSAIGRATYIAKATLAGAGTVSALAQRIIYGVANLTGSGVVACIGTVGGIIHQGTATLVGVGTVVAKAVAYYAVKSSLSGSGTVAAIGQRIVNGIGAFTGSGALVAKGALIYAGKATLAGVGIISAIGQRIVYGVAILTGSGVLAAIGRLIATGKATISGIGNLAAIGTIGAGLTHYASASLAGIGTLTAVAIMTYKRILRALTNVSTSQDLNLTTRAHSLYSITSTFSQGLTITSTIVEK